MNRHSRRTLIILATLLALPVEAQVAAPRSQSAPAKPAAPGLRTRIDLALEAARARVLAGDLDKAAYEELVTAIRESFGGLEHATPDASSVRARLVAAVDDIYTRARSARIAPDEFAALRVDVLDAELASTLAETSAHPAETGLDPLTAGLKELADAAQAVDPATSEWRARAEALLAGLRKKAVVEAADLVPLGEELAHARALRAEALLEKHATEKVATPTDFARARNHIADHLELQSKHDPKARELQKKLLAALDALEHRAGESGLTRADFDELRKQLTLRARAALADEQKPRG